MTKQGQEGAKTPFEEALDKEFGEGFSDLYDKNRCRCCNGTGHHGECETECANCDGTGKVSLP